MLLNYLILHSSLVLAHWNTVLTFAGIFFMQRLLVSPTLVVIYSDAPWCDQTDCLFLLLAVIQDSCARVLLFRGANKEIKNYNSQTAFQVGSVFPGVFTWWLLLMLSILNLAKLVICFILSSIIFSPSCVFCTEPSKHVLDFLFFSYIIL